jgi:hypothetical protein
VGSNINDFLKETNKAIEAELVKQQKEATKIILGAYSEIIQESPKDTGLFRHNHFVTVNSKTNQTTGDEFDPSMIAVIEGAEQNIKTAKLKHGTTITIQNNLSYADALESGHSKKQAPAGIYGVTEEKIRKEIGKTITIK